MLVVASGMVNTKDDSSFIALARWGWGGGEGAICVISVGGGVFVLWLSVERGG